MALGSAESLWGWLDKLVMGVDGGVDRQRASAGGDLFPPCMGAKGWVDRTDRLVVGSSSFHVWGWTGRLMAGRGWTDRRRKDGQTDWWGGGGRTDGR